MNNQQLNQDRSIIAFTAFLNFLGLTLAFPVFIPLMSDHGGLLPLTYTKELRGLLLGVLLGIYPLVQFFTAPIFGVLSDRVGRKPILIMSAIGNLLGFIVLSFGIATHHFWLVIFGRIISGCFSGSLAVTQSAMSDISTTSTKSANFGLLGATFGASLALGPAIGGVLSDTTHGPFFTLATPFVAAAVFSLINIILLIFNLTETLPKTHRQHTKFHVLTGPKNFLLAFSDPKSQIIFLVIFLVGFGFNFFSQFFQYYLIERFAITNTQFGMLFGYIGLWSIISQGLINNIVSKHFSSDKILKFSLFALAIVFPGLLLIPSYGWLYAVAFLTPVMNGLSIPNLTTLVSDLADQKGQGRIMGINQSVQSVAMLFPPLVGGFLVGLNYTMPIWVAFFIILSAWFLFVWKYKKPSAT